MKIEKGYTLVDQYGNARQTYRPARQYAKGGLGYYAVPQGRYGLSGLGADDAASMTAGLSNTLVMGAVAALAVYWFFLR